MMKVNFTLLCVSALFLSVVHSSLANDLPSPVVDSDYHYDGAPDDELVELGRMLFFDKIMSGNQNISCATCHNPMTFSGDGLSLGVGEGGKGLGRYRSTGDGEDAIEARIGRHAPHLYNLGAKEFTHMNWNGLHFAENGEVKTAANRDTPPDLHNVLAGQALFPILNQNEMLGDPIENEIVARLIISRDNSFPPLWNAYMERLRVNPDYVRLFDAAFDDVNRPADIEIQHYANAVAAFQTVAFRSDNSPFDANLRGDSEAMTAQQVRGMDLFYGAANCSSCHSGKFQTDHQFYGIAIPQVGPGGEAGTPHQDRGRAEATRMDEDWGKFRTPSLRNVALTAPYGHTGAYATLRGIVRHHLDPLTALENYDPSQLVKPSREDLDESDLVGHEDLSLRQIVIDASDLQPVSLTETEVDDLLAFLEALTDLSVMEDLELIPQSVPSGLPVKD
ncbi:MAG: cytochrome c peroxidase [Pseudomonadota bacterium]|nr:cytochrome c peroxidase [Pseudomonadota bacterium]